MLPNFSGYMLRPKPCDDDINDLLEQVQHADIGNMPAIMFHLWRVQGVGATRQKNDQAISLPPTITLLGSTFERSTAVLHHGKGASSGHNTVVHGNCALPQGHHLDDDKDVSPLDWKQVESSWVTVIYVKAGSPVHDIPAPPAQSLSESDCSLCEHLYCASAFATSANVVAGTSRADATRTKQHSGGGRPASRTSHRNNVSDNSNEHLDVCARGFKRPPDLIVHGRNGGEIWLGGEEALDNPTFVRGVHLIISAYDHLPRLPDGERMHLQFNIAYGPDRTRQFYKVMTELKTGFDEGKKCFVHCRAGVHRAATATAIFLMYGLQITFLSAVALVEKARPIVQIQEVVAATNRHGRQQEPWLVWIKKWEEDAKQWKQYAFQEASTIRGTIAENATRDLSMPSPVENARSIGGPAKARSTAPVGEGAQVVPTGEDLSLGQHSAPMTYAEAGGEGGSSGSGSHTSPNHSNLPSADAAVHQPGPVAIAVDFAGVAKEIIAAGKEKDWNPWKALVAEERELLAKLQPGSTAYDSECIVGVQFPDHWVEEIPPSSTFLRYHSTSFTALECALAFAHHGNNAARLAVGWSTTGGSAGLYYSDTPWGATLYMQGGVRKIGVTLALQAPCGVKHSSIHNRSTNRPMETVIRAAWIYHTERRPVTESPQLGDRHPMLDNPKLVITPAYRNYCLRVAGCSLAGRYVSAPLMMGQDVTSMLKNIGEPPPAVDDETIKELIGANGTQSPTSATAPPLASSAERVTRESRHSQCSDVEADSVTNRRAFTPAGDNHRAVRRRLDSLSQRERQGCKDVAESPARQKPHIPQPTNDVLQNSAQATTAKSSAADRVFPGPTGNPVPKVPALLQTADHGWAAFCSPGPWQRPALPKPAPFRHNVHTEKSNTGAAEKGTWSVNGGAQNHVSSTPVAPASTPSLTGLPPAPARLPAAPSTAKSGSEHIPCRNTTPVAEGEHAYLPGIWKSAKQARSKARAVRHHLAKAASIAKGLASSPEGAGLQAGSPCRASSGFPGDKEQKQVRELRDYMFPWPPVQFMRAVVTKSDVVHSPLHVCLQVQALPWLCEVFVHVSSPAGATYEVGTQFAEGSQIVILRPNLSQSGAVSFVVANLEDVLRCQPDVEQLKVYHLCSGIGGFTQAAEYCQLQNAGGMDFNELANKTYAANFHPPSVCLDITTESAIRAVLLAGPFILTAGVPCQPFSTGGDAKGFLDTRSRPFLHALLLFFVCNAGYLVLENVSGIQAIEEVQRLLNIFGVICQCTFTQRHCNLLHISPMSRERWFAVGVRSSLPRLCFPPWPERPVPAWSREHQIFQRPRERDLVQLALSDEEKRVYLNPAYGPLSRRYIAGYNAFPTLVHAYGNALTACPCGCRAQGFSAARLLERGAWGVLCAHHEGQKCTVAWAHPEVLAHLMGFPRSFKLPRDLRLALAQLGNAVSVYQAVWVLSAVRAATSRQAPEHVFARSLSLLSMYSSEVGVAYHSAIAPGIYFDLVINDELPQRYVLPMDVGVERLAALVASLVPPGLRFDLMYQHRKLCPCDKVAWRQYNLVRVRLCSGEDTQLAVEQATAVLPHLPQAASVAGANLVAGTTQATEQESVVRPLQIPHVLAHIFEYVYPCQWFSTMDLRWEAYEYYTVWHHVIEQMAQYRNLLNECCNAIVQHRDSAGTVGQRLVEQAQYMDRYLQQFDTDYSWAALHNRARRANNLDIAIRDMWTDDDELFESISLAYSEEMLKLSNLLRRRGHISIDQQRQEAVLHAVARGWREVALDSEANNSELNTVIWNTYRFAGCSCLEQIQRASHLENLCRDAAQNFARSPRDSTHIAYIKALRRNLLANTWCMQCGSYCYTIHSWTQALTETLPRPLVNQLLDHDVGPFTLRELRHLVDPLAELVAQPQHNSNLFAGNGSVGRTQHVCRWLGINSSCGISAGEWFMHALRGCPPAMVDGPVGIEVTCRICHVQVSTGTVPVVDPPTQHCGFLGCCASHCGQCCYCHADCQVDPWMQQLCVLPSYTADINLVAGASKHMLDNIHAEIVRRKLRATFDCIRLLANSNIARLSAAHEVSMQADIICGAARKAGIHWEKIDSSAAPKPGGSSNSTNAGDKGKVGNLSSTTSVRNSGRNGKAGGKGNHKNQGIAPPTVGSIEVGADWQLRSGDWNVPVLPPSDFHLMQQNGVSLLTNQAAKLIVRQTGRVGFSIAMLTVSKITDNSTRLEVPVLVGVALDIFQLWITQLGEESKPPVALRDDTPSVSLTTEGTVEVTVQLHWAGIAAVVKEELNSISLKQQTGDTKQQQEHAQHGPRLEPAQWLRLRIILEQCLAAPILSLRALHAVPTYVSIQARVHGARRLHLLRQSGVDGIMVSLTTQSDDYAVIRPGADFHLEGKTVWEQATWLHTLLREETGFAGVVCPPRGIIVRFEAKEQLAFRALLNPSFKVATKGHSTYTIRVSAQVEGLDLVKALHANGWPCEFLGTDIRGAKQTVRVGSPTAPGRTDFRMKLNGQVLYALVELDDAVQAGTPPHKTTAAQPTGIAAPTQSPTNHPVPVDPIEALRIALAAAGITDITSLSNLFPGNGTAPQRRRDRSPSARPEPAHEITKERSRSPVPSRAAEDNSPSDANNLMAGTHQTPQTVPRLQGTHQKAQQLAPLYGSGDELSATMPPPLGLRNVGNTCWRAAAIQFWRPLQEIARSDISKLYKLSATRDEAGLQNQWSRYLNLAAHCGMQDSVGSEIFRIRQENDKLVEEVVCNTHLSLECFGCGAEHLMHDPTPCLPVHDADDAPWEALFTNVRQGSIARRCECFAENALVIGRLALPARAFVVQAFRDNAGGTRHNPSMVLPAALIGPDYRVFSLASWVNFAQATKQLGHFTSCWVRSPSHVILFDDSSSRDMHIDLARDRTVNCWMFALYIHTSDTLDASGGVEPSPVPAAFDVHVAFPPPPLLQPEQVDTLIRATNEYSPNPATASVATTNTEGKCEGAFARPPLVSRTQRQSAPLNVPVAGRASATSHVHKRKRGKGSTNASKGVARPPMYRDAFPPTRPAEGLEDSNPPVARRNSTAATFVPSQTALRFVDTLSTAQLERLRQLLTSQYNWRSLTAILKSTPAPPPLPRVYRATQPSPDTSGTPTDAEEVGGAVDARNPIMDTRAKRVRRTKIALAMQAGRTVNLPSVRLSRGNNKITLQPVTSKEEANSAIHALFHTTGMFKNSVVEVECDIEALAQGSESVAGGHGKNENVASLPDASGSDSDCLLAGNERNSRGVIIHQNVTGIKSRWRTLFKEEFDVLCATESQHTALAQTQLEYSWKFRRDETCTAWTMPYVRGDKASRGCVIVARNGWRVCAHPSPVEAVGEDEQGRVLCAVVVNPSG